MDSFSPSAKNHNIPLKFSQLCARFRWYLSLRDWHNFICHSTRIGRLFNTKYHAALHCEVCVSSEGKVPGGCTPTYSNPLSGSLICSHALTKTPEFSLQKLMACIRPKVKHWNHDERCRKVRSPFDEVEVRCTLPHRNIGDFSPPLPHFNLTFRQHHGRVGVITRYGHWTTPFVLPTRCGYYLFIPIT